MKRSFVLVHKKTYEEVTNENAIRLMLRGFKLYQALTEIRKVLKNDLKVEIMYSFERVLAIIEKYDLDENMTVKIKNNHKNRITSH